MTDDYMAYILYTWQSGYCAGAKMPPQFREKATELFEAVYNATDPSHPARNVPSTIYRVMTCSQYETRPHLVIFDDSYYSFSADIGGLKKVVMLDKFLSDDILLIEAQPIDALDFNIMNGDDSESENKYAKEHEVVSKCSKDSIVNMYFLRTAEDIDDYKTKGILIDNKDVTTRLSKVGKKYNLWLTETSEP